MMRKTVEGKERGWGVRRTSEGIVLMRNKDSERGGRR